MADTKNSSSENYANAHADSKTDELKETVAKEQQADDNKEKKETENNNHNSDKSGAETPDTATSDNHKNGYTEPPYNDTALSEIKLEENLIKKKGFLIAHDPNIPDVFTTEIAITRYKYHQHIFQYKANQDEKIIFLQQSIDLLKEKIIEVKLKRDEYEVHLKTLPGEREKIDEKVKEIEKDVYELLKKVGEEKDKIVETSLINLKNQLKSLLDICKDIQVQQNTDLDAEAARTKDLVTEKLSLYKEILKERTAQFNKITAKVNHLASDGINEQIASFLVFLGSTATLMAGWWFAVWAGPVNTSGTILRSAMNILFIDNLGSLFTTMPVWQVMTAIFAYILLLGAISLGSYRLLVKFGYISPDKSGKKKKTTDKDDVNEKTEIEFDLKKINSLANYKVKANSWWGIWLKIVPLLLAIAPVLGVVSRQIAIDSKTHTGPTFQSLFSAVENQLTGTTYAILISIVCILYISRAVEQRYHNMYEKGEKDERDENGGLNKNYLLITGAVLFLISVIMMLLYHSNIAFLGDIRNAAMCGFVCCSLLAGLSFGYGFLFRGLKENWYVLLTWIEDISDYIFYLSRPYRVNYTTNRMVRDRIRELQDQMFDVIKNRSLLAINISEDFFTGDDEKDNSKNQPPAKEAEGETVKKDEQQENKEQETKSTWRSAVSSFFNNLFKRKKKNAIKTDGSDIMQHNITDADLKYFSALGTCIVELKNKLAELKKDKDALLAEESNYMRNEGTYGALYHQIKKLEEEWAAISRRIDSIRNEMLIEEAMLLERLDKEVVLLKEGYMTGIWLQKKDPIFLLIENPHA